MQNLRYGKEIKIHFISIHVLVCLPIYDVNISLFRPIQLGFSLLPSPNPSPTQLPPGSQVIGDGQIFVIRVKIVLKKMGGEKSRTCVQGSCSLFRLNLSLFYYYFFFSFKSFLYASSVKSRYHKSFYFESFKIRNSQCGDNQLFRVWTTQVINWMIFFLANQYFFMI